MKKILVIGAGRSTVSLIDYLITHAIEGNWHVTVADVNLEWAQGKVAGRPNATAIQINIDNAEERMQRIEESDFVISMLPAFMHMPVALDCIKAGKHLATASYVSPEMQALDAEAKQKNILLLNECGLDPGIDHASAMKVIDEVHEQGGEIVSFKSFCGGLVAPESNDNPWGYKFSWNPRNVVVAGQSTAHYLQEGEIKYIPYNRIFTQIETVDVDGHLYDAYANRDSLSYQHPYGLKNIKTLLRGTLRYPGYCKAWNVFVKLGLTDDTYVIKNIKGKTYKQFLQAYLPGKVTDAKKSLAELMGHEADKEAIDKVEWLGFFNDTKIELEQGTPAQILQHLLEKKWLLQPSDKDLVVMQHQFEIDNSMNNKLPKRIISSLYIKGTDQHHTAMAKTVGLPLAICVKNFLTDKFKAYGVQIPTTKEIYAPLLAELEEHGIIFKENFIS